MSEFLDCQANLDFQNPELSSDPISALVFTNENTQPLFAMTWRHNEMEPAKHFQFTLFPYLPTELRIKIWEHALPGPRVVYLKQRLAKERDVLGRYEGVIKGYEGGARHPDRGDIWVNPSKIQTVRYKQDNPVEFFSDSPQPNILHVCRESASIVKEHYARCFSTWNTTAQIWFNCKIDTLYLCPGSFACTKGLEGDIGNLKYCLDDRLWRPAKGTFEGVQRLALLKMVDLEDQGALISSVAAWFSNVPLVEIVLEDYSKGVYNDLKLIDPINVPLAIEIYGHPQIEKSEEVAMPCIPPLDVFTYSPDMELLERMNHFWEEHGAEPRICPTVELKVLVSPQMLQEMETMKSVCQKRIDKHNHMVNGSVSSKYVLSRLLNVGVIF